MKKLQYTLVGFTPFGENDRPKIAKVLSRHYNYDTTIKAFNTDNTGLCLDIKKYNHEVVGQDMIQYMCNQI